MRTKLAPEQRRNVIVQAAVRIGLAEGITAVTHSGVAKRCVVQTSKETVKYYFPVKADLWAAAVAADETGTLREQEKQINGC